MRARVQQFISGKKTRAYHGIFRNFVGIDLGTTRTIAGVEGKGVFFDEPTLLAVNKQTAQVVAIGEKARTMIDRTPPYIEVIQPVRDGVVNNFDIAVELFRQIFKKAQALSQTIFGPVVVVGIPCCAAPVEISSLQDAALDAGAGSVHIIDEPFAAAVGLGFSLEKEEASMVVDVGGGTSDALVLASGEIIATDSIRIGGNVFDTAIVSGLKKQKRLLIGLRTAEDLKIQIMKDSGREKVYKIRGTNIETQLPLEAEVTDNEILTFIFPCLEEIIRHLSKFIESLSPEIQADLKRGEIYFVGGGQSVYIFAEKIEEALNLKVTVPKNPMMLVARGTAMIAKDAGRYEKYFLK